MKLYELAGEYQALMESITDCVDDGVKFEAMTESLGKLEGDIATKVENCAKMVRALDARAKAYKHEADFFTAKAKAANGSSERLEDYMQWCLESVGMEKIEGKTLSVKLCNNSQPSLVVTEPDKVPKKFTIKVDPKVDNQAIKDALLAGKKLSFARLDYGKHIRIS